MLAFIYVKKTPLRASRELHWGGYSHFYILYMGLNPFTDVLETERHFLQVIVMYTRVLMCHKKISLKRNKCAFPLLLAGAWWLGRG